MDTQINLTIQQEELVSRIEKSFFVIDEASYDFFTNYPELIKGKKDLTKLVSIKKPVVRDGKIFIETVWVDPNKNQDIGPKYSKEYKNKREFKEKKNVGTTRIEDETFQRGDKVKFKIGEEEVVGEFRHIAVNEIKNIPFAMIRYEGKTYGRKPKDISLAEEKQAVPKLRTDKDFKIGDKVQLELLVKDGGVSKRQNFEATISRFTKTTPAGQLVQVRLENGKIYERFTHNLFKLDESSPSNLTPDQEVIVNKALNKLGSENRINNELIEVYQKSQAKDKEDRILKCHKEIDDNNVKIKDYLEVLEGKRTFDSVSEEAPVYKRQEKPKVEAVISEEEKIEEEPKEIISEEQKRIDELSKEILQSKLNIVRDRNKDDYVSLRNIYVAKKKLQENLEESISLKEKINIPLTSEEEQFKSSPRQDLVKPEKPKQVEPEKGQTLKTITTYSSNKPFEEKKEELLTLIDKAKQTLKNEESRQKYVKKYEDTLNKLIKKESPERKEKILTKDSISSDVEKVKSGDFKNIMKLNINQRISDSKLSDEDKRELRLAFSDAIKIGVKAKRLKEVNLVKAIELVETICADINNFEK